jgi:hypothetical protein
MLVTAMAVTLLTVPLAAAPPASYFPLPVGATWTRRADDGVEVTARVTETKTVGSAECTVLETRTGRGLGGGVVRVCYEQSAEAVHALETRGLGITLRLEPPRPVLQFPPQAGKSWSWTPKNLPLSMTVTDTWLQEESVRVPAGTFTAWKLQSVSKRGSATATLYTWYAMGVGIVKVVREENGVRDPEGSSELIRYQVP